MARKMMKSLEKICSVCGVKIIVIHPSTYLYKTTYPRTQYQCSEKCWKKEKSVKKDV